MAQVPGQPESPTPDAPDAPDAFKAELQALYGGRAEVSGSVDDAVRAAARQAFAGPAMTTTTASPRQTGVLYRIAGTLAAAAALGLVLILSGVFSPNDRSNNLRPNGTNPRLALTGDVNADDTINIVDAYLLQRRIEQGATLESTWDLTGDGKVDAQDVQAIATAAVKIQRVSAEDRGSPLATDGTMYVQADAIRFTTFDIIIDTKDAPLAVYQLDIKTTAGDVQITGIEGGGHDAFRQPPYYDSQAMQQSRVILAAFNTADADRLPRGKVRVATLHVQITGDEEPKFEVKLDAAATVDGHPIEATATLQAKRTQL